MSRGDRSVAWLAASPSATSAVRNYFGTSSAVRSRSIFCCVSHRGMNSITILQRVFPLPSYTCNDVLCRDEAATWLRL